MKSLLWVLNLSGGILKDLQIAWTGSFNIRDIKTIALFGVRMRPEVFDFEKMKRYGRIRILIRVRLENYIDNLREKLFVREEEIEGERFEESKLLFPGNIP